MFKTNTETNTGDRRDTELQFTVRAYLLWQKSVDMFTQYELS